MVGTARSIADAASTRQKAASDILRRRREAALARIDEDTSGILIKKAWSKFSDPTVRETYLDLDHRAGLAFSGGGIRSATIALGLSEALASRGRLYAFDMLSTVSGGGYFGSFLRALHVPRLSSRSEQDVVTDRLALAEATMTSLPDQQYFRGSPGNSAFVAEGRTVKNPLWWLRENGRYLAPGGMSDYGFALAYIVRNWVSLLLFLLGLALVVFGVLQSALLALVNMSWGRDAAIMTWLAANHLYTPLLPVLAVFFLAVVGVAAAYWLATPLAYSRRPPAPPASNAPPETQSTDPDSQSSSAGGWIRVALVGLFLLLLLGGTVLGHVRDWLPQDPVARSWIISLEIGLAAALLSAAFTSRRKVVGNASDFRREQTRLLASCLVVLTLLAAITAIDWAALWLRLYLDSSPTNEGSGEILKTGALSGALASAVSFLIAKLPDWFGGKTSGIGKFLIAHARKFALLAALIIIASIALLADILAIKLLWHGQAWITESSPEWLVFGVVVGLVGFVALLFATSLNFTNLLALTPFYGSRLTRAFLGGSNVHRLNTGSRSEVTQGLDDDDIDLQTYMETDCAAPLHFVNVTRNRTIGEPTLHKEIDVEHDDPLVLESVSDPRGRLVSYESSLTLHDRHGDRMVFGPCGLRVGAEFYDWGDMDNPPSLGLLCAISGAAVGAGMGRLTSLGTSMAFTLANVRLGYWWQAQKAKGQKDANGGHILARRFPGLNCLGRELLGRFGTRDFWFLSDGGHSENSGVLTLLERGCRFILASDNGEDENFEFCDLEILIRTARTDIGVEVSLVPHDDFPKNLEPVRDCFLNGSEGDWRVHARTPDHPGFALLLRAADIPRRVNGVWTQRRGGHGLIVWLKPRPFAGLPADVGTYAAVHKDFPQQSTGNQFFDEAQWESYRRLGFQMGRRLFAKREPFDPYLPVIFAKSNVAAGGAPKAGASVVSSES